MAKLISRIWGKDDLIDAARNGKTDVIERFLAKKQKNPLSLLSGNQAIVDKEGYTLLHHAALNGHKAIVQLLLDDESALKTGNAEGGLTPVHLAATQGHFEICHLLLTHENSQFKVNAQDANGDTSLHYGAQHGKFPVVSVLLQCGADPVIRNLKQESPLELACQFGYQEIVEHLLNKFPDLPQMMFYNRSPLHLAAQKGYQAIITILLEAGFDINVRTEEGTALHVAVKFYKLDCVKLLLRKGIDVHAVSNANETALAVAKRIESQSNKISKQIVQCITDKYIQEEEDRNVHVDIYAVPKKERKTKERQTQMLEKLPTTPEVPVRSKSFMEDPMGTGSVNLFPQEENLITSPPFMPQAPQPMLLPTQSSFEYPSEDNILPQSTDKAPASENKFDAPQFLDTVMPLPSCHSHNAGPDLYCNVPLEIPPPPCSGTSESKHVSVSWKHTDNAENQPTKQEKKQTPPKPARRKRNMGESISKSQESLASQEDDSEPSSGSYLTMTDTPTQPTGTCDKKNVSVSDDPTGNPDVPLNTSSTATGVIAGTVENYEEIGSVFSEVECSKASSDKSVVQDAQEKDQRKVKRSDDDTDDNYEAEADYMPVPLPRSKSFKKKEEEGEEVIKDYLPSLPSKKMLEAINSKRAARPVTADDVPTEDYLPMGDKPGQLPHDYDEPEDYLRMDHDSKKDLRGKEDYLLMSNKRGGKPEEEEEDYLPMKEKIDRGREDYLTVEGGKKQDIIESVNTEYSQMNAVKQLKESKESKGDNLSKHAEFVDEIDTYDMTSSFTRCTKPERELSRSVHSDDVDVSHSDKTGTPDSLDQSLPSDTDYENSSSLFVHKSTDLEQVSSDPLLSSDSSGVSSLIPAIPTPKPRARCGSDSKGSPDLSGTRATSNSQPVKSPPVPMKRKDITRSMEHILMCDNDAGEESKNSSAPSKEEATHSTDELRKPTSLELLNRQLSGEVSGFPPTPDFPPPSPDTANMVLTEQIVSLDSSTKWHARELEKRLSKDMETSTELDLVDTTPQDPVADSSSFPNPPGVIGQSLHSISEEKDVNGCTESANVYETIFNVKVTQSDPPGVASSSAPGNHANGGCEPRPEDSDHFREKSDCDQANQGEECDSKVVLRPKSSCLSASEPPRKKSSESGSSSSQEDLQHSEDHIGILKGLLRGSRKFGQRRVLSQFIDNERQIQRDPRHSFHIGMKMDNLQELADDKQNVRKSWRGPHGKTGTNGDGSLDDSEDWKQVEGCFQSIGMRLSNRESVALHEMIIDYIKRGKQVKCVGDWLEEIDLGQYENTLVANGFDHIDFLAGNIMEERDLEMIGIKDADHRKKIMDSAKQLKVLTPVDPDNLPHSVEEWLESLHLDNYLSTFMNHKYETMEKILQLWDFELDSVLDITALGHRKRILESLKKRKPPDRQYPSLKKRATGADDRESYKGKSYMDVQLYKDYTKVKPVSSSEEDVKGTSQQSLPSVDSSEEEEVFTMKQSKSINDNSIHLRPPNQSMETSPVREWRHPPDILIKGCCNYTAQYLGSTLVTELSEGTGSTIQGMKKLKKSSELIAKIPTIMLSISYRGVKFIDARSKNVVCDHEIINIFCACQDAENMNFFAYITRDSQTGHHYCHVFNVRTPDMAREIILTLGEAFEVAYQVAQKAKAAEDSLEFERQLSQSDLEPDSMSVSSKASINTV